MDTAKKEDKDIIELPKHILEFFERGMRVYSRTIYDHIDCILFNNISNINKRKKIVKEVKEMAEKNIVKDKTSLVDFIDNFYNITWMFDKYDWFDDYDSGKKDYSLAEKDEYLDFSDEEFYVNTCPYTSKAQILFIPIAIKGVKAFFIRYSSKNIYITNAEYYFLEEIDIMNVKEMVMYFTKKGLKTISVDDINEEELKAIIENINDAIINHCEHLFDFLHIEEIIMKTMLSHFEQTKKQFEKQFENMKIKL